MSASAALAHWAILAALLSVFAGLLYWRLRAAEYQRVRAAAFSFVALAQPAFAVPATAIRSVLVAIAAYAIGSTAAGFVQRQDPRRIVLLGGSLAGAQLVHPVWGTLTTIMLPLALRRQVTATSSARTAGLYVSLLFIPALSSAALLYLSLAEHFDGVQWRGFLSPGTYVAIVSAAVLPAAPLFIALARAPSKIHALPLALLCALMVAMNIVGSCVAAQPLPGSGAALAALAILLIAQWPPSATRDRTAALLMVSSLALSWTAALITAELAHA
jgi:hypothetical protein